MKAIFSRVPPTDKTEQLSLGWVAISHRWFNDKQTRRDAYGTVYKIKSKSGGVIYRNLKFSPRLKGSTSQGKGQILLDWQGWINLCEIEEEGGEIELTIKKANVFQIFYHSMTHPEPAYRHSMALARVGVYISVVTLIVAFK